LEYNKKESPVFIFSIEEERKVKIFGAGYNLSLFENHIAVVLKRAGFDSDKALP